MQVYSPGSGGRVVFYWQAGGLASRKQNPTQRNSWAGDIQRHACLPLDRGWRRARHSLTLLVFGSVRTVAGTGIPLGHVVHQRCGVRFHRRVRNLDGARRPGVPSIRCAPVRNDRYLRGFHHVFHVRTGNPQSGQGWSARQGWSERAVVAGALSYRRLARPRLRRLLEPPEKGAL